MVFFSLIYGLYVSTPFLAPLFMQLGWHGVGKTIYLIYSFLCHQLPQRSFFLFGLKHMYSLNEIQTVWGNTLNPLLLRQFIGNAEMGWKVAWSDRMVSMYTSILIFAWLWYLFHRRIKTLPLWGLTLFLMPMGIDGITHTLSDFFGIGQGFRYHNAWLAAVTNNAYPPTFYIGDAQGSFNSWLRLITGILFGVGIVWFGFPYLEKFFLDLATSLKTKLRNTN